MNLYLLSQEDRTGYDTFNAVVVAAESEEDARTIHPVGGNNWTSMTWASSPDNVSVRKLGMAAKGLKRGIILSSFNAG